MEKVWALEKSWSNPRHRETRAPPNWRRVRVCLLCFWWWQLSESPFIPVSSSSPAAAGSVCCCLESLLASSTAATRPFGVRTHSRRTHTRSSNTPSSAESSHTFRQCRRMIKQVAHHLGCSVLLSTSQPASFSSLCLMIVSERRKSWEAIVLWKLPYTHSIEQQQQLRPTTTRQHSVDWGRKGHRENSHENVGARLNVSSIGGFTVKWLAIIVCGLHIPLLTITTDYHHHQQLWFAHSPNKRIPLQLNSHCLHSAPNLCVPFRVLAERRTGRDWRVMLR